MKARKGCWLGVVLIVYLMILKVGIVKRAYGQDIPEEIVIDKGGYGTDIYGEVLFKHGEHILEFNIGCKICHHDWKQEEKGLPNKCCDCHEVKDKEKTSLRDAYMNNCRGCHSNLKIEGKPSGPTRCDECHNKKKQVR